MPVSHTGPPQSPNTRRLPGNRIARPEFPLVVNFRETGAVMVLPVPFWPPEPAALWPGQGGR